MKLELNNLAKSFHGVGVLRDLSLRVDGMRRLALVGPSGGGKSTLLRILAGLLPPDGGEVMIENEALPRTERALLAYRRRIGTVFQSYNLFPHLTALRNITLPLVAVHGRAPAEANDTARDLLRRFDLEDHAKKKPAQLSGGQQQRVAIIRAVAAKPRWILFDEPTSALDPVMAGEVLAMIEQIGDEGGDILLVTHQLGFARRVAQRAVLLVDGRVAEEGPVAQVLDTPRSEAARNFLHAASRYT